MTEEKKISIKRAVGEGTKDTLAVALITTGVSLINSGDYFAGGGLVFIGWILLVYDALKR